MRTARRRGDDGATALEFTGLILLAAMIVAAIGAAFAPQPIVQVTSTAVCKIVTFGQGGCQPVAPPEEHLPPQPCVTGTQTGSAGGEISVVVVTVGDTRSYEVAELSDGRYRVTLLQQGEVGAGVGVGGGITVTVDDKTYGGNAEAGVGANLALQGGETWYVDSPGDVEELLNHQVESAVKDYTVGHGPVRGILDWGQEQLGIGSDPPEPDEVTVAGGLTMNASAEATGLVNNLGAEVGTTQLLGVKTARNGENTIYISTKVEGQAGFQQLGINTDGVGFQGAKGEGSLQMVTAVKFDSSGEMVEVSTTATAAGETKGIANGLFGDPSLDNSRSGSKVYTATLPIRSQADRDLALQYLAATGAQQLGGPLVQAASAVPSAFATTRFVDAARSHGFLTQQTFTTDNKTVAGANASGKLGIELGGGFEVKSGSSASDGAQYWDGQSWQEWGACG